MMLHNNRLIPETLSVHAAKVGRRFDSIELDANDFAQLALLHPDTLQEWVRDWMLGFPPQRIRK